MVIGFIWGYICKNKENSKKDTCVILQKMCVYFIMI